MIRPWYARWRALALALDAVFVGAALVGFAVARFGTSAIRDGFVPAPGREFAQAPLLFAIPVWLGVFATARLYSPSRCQNALEEGRRLIMSGLGAGVTLVMLGFLLKENPARSWLLGAMVLGTLSAAIGRKSLRAVVAAKRRKGRWTARTVVVGREQGKAVVQSLQSNPAAGMEPVGTCGFAFPGLPTRDLSDLAGAAATWGASTVIVVAEGLERSEMGRAMEVADESPLNVIVLPGLDHLLLSTLQLVTVVNEPGLALDAPGLHTWQRVAKRAIDIASSGVLLAVMAPVMAVIAALVRLDTPGPMIFRQKREGRSGEPFEALKFRTMRAEVDAPPPDLGDDLSFLSKPRADDRVTRVGRVLRRSSMDELPQLWNVLRGDMSLVGPRPLPLWEAERLGLRRRLIVRPGLTGLWQVSGRSSLSAEERVRLDLVYVQNWSLLLDLSILLRTVPAVVGGSGAY